MNSSLIPRIAEIPLDEFDAEYRGAEIEHRVELEQMISELEEAAQLVDLSSCDYFSGARKTVLDVGCGIGTLPFLLAQKNPAATVIGVDISAESIAYAREHYEPRAANLSYHVGSVTDLEERFRDIDLVTCVGALHHFPSLDQSMRQIMRTLKNDGAFLLSDLNRENIHAHFSDEELQYLDSVRRLPEKPRYSKLRRQGYTKGKKMRRFLTLMSFQAAYTPGEVAQALGPGYVFKGRMSGMNYILVAHRKTG